MANSLLDFVMSVVRDPDAAAAYAANPGQAIADAHLVDVTSVDVNNLIPVVAESMSAAVPSDTLGDTAHNVWASGAATAAFDAFGDHLPLQGGDVIAAHASNVIALPGDAAPAIADHVIDDGGAPLIAAGSDSGLFDQTLPADAPTFDDVHVADLAPDDALDGVHHAVDHPQDHPQDPGFDIFT
jgi:hypothetical protein